MSYKQKRNISNNSRNGAKNSRNQNPKPSKSAAIRQLGELHVSTPSDQEKWIEDSYLSVHSFHQLRTLMRSFDGATRRRRLPFRTLQSLADLDSEARYALFGITSLVESSARTQLALRLTKSLDSEADAKELMKELYSSVGDGKDDDNLVDKDIYQYNKRIASGELLADPLNADPSPQEIIPALSFYRMQSLYSVAAEHFSPPGEKVSQWYNRRAIALESVRRLRNACAHHDNLLPTMTLNEEEPFTPDKKAKGLEKVLLIPDELIERFANNATAERILTTFWAYLRLFGKPDTENKQVIRSMGDLRESIRIFRIQNQKQDAKMRRLIPALEYIDYFATFIDVHRDTYMNPVQPGRPDFMADVYVDW